MVRSLFRLIVLPVLIASSARAADGAQPCVFCGIVAGQREGATVYRDERVMAFLSIGPRNPGHVLIVPVVHAADFLEVPPETVLAMTAAARRVVEAIRRTDIRCEGFRLEMANGAAAGQSVPHAHLHVIPRYAGEPPEKRPAEIVPLAELEPVAAKIRASLSALPPATAAPRPALPPLPAMNEEVPLARIKELCAAYGLQELWRKIERDPPIRPFKSDGCTGWFNEWKGISIYPAGFFHDLRYWAGYPGEDVERLVADAELMNDVARLLGSTAMAETMFHGVRLGGTEKLNAEFSWGFGRHPLEPTAKADEAHPPVAGRGK